MGQTQQVAARTETANGLSCVCDRCWLARVVDGSEFLYLGVLVLLLLFRALPENAVVEQLARWLEELLLSDKTRKQTAGDGQRESDEESGNLAARLLAGGETQCAFAFLDLSGITLFLLDSNFVCRRIAVWEHGSNRIAVSLIASDKRRKSSTNGTHYTRHAVKIVDTTLYTKS